jgi:hypothetical protein
VRGRSSGRGHQTYLVTEAAQSRSAEINQRQRRYLIMMGIRVVCFVVTVVLFLNHGGWLTVIPAFGAIALPYFAVVIANSRQPGSSAGFQPYEPNLPERYRAEPGGAQQEGAEPGGAQSDGAERGTAQPGKDG